MSWPYPPSAQNNRAPINSYLKPFSSSSSSSSSTSSSSSSSSSSFFFFFLFFFSSYFYFSSSPFSSLVLFFFLLLACHLVSEPGSVHLGRSNRGDGDGDNDDNDMMCHDEVVSIQLSTEKNKSNDQSI